ncbi:MAG: hypothetical protein U5L11_09500 [Arhodomonas sp.]|nr:hypothetical protein [Arhodomonas sp.]
MRINDSELRDLAVDELKVQVPEHCHHMEVIVTPTESALPSLHLPVDLNDMTQQQAMPFTLPMVPSSFLGRAVNVVHIDGAIPARALAQLESDIMRLTGIRRPPLRLPGRSGEPSTIGVHPTLGCMALSRPCTRASAAAGSAP